MNVIFQDGTDSAMVHCNVGNTLNLEMNSGVTTLKKDIGEKSNGRGKPNVVVQFKLCFKAMASIKA